MFGALGLQLLQALHRLRQFRFGGGGAQGQFGGALFVGADARFTAVGFDGDVAEPVAIFAGLRFDGIAALGAVGVLGFRLLDGIGQLVNLLAEFVHLGIERCVLPLHLCELAGEHDAQVGAHLVAQAAITLGLAGLAFQRIHLTGDFFEDVVDAVEIQL